MTRFVKLLIPAMAFVLIGAIASPARAAGSGVQDNAHLFSEDTVTQANNLIRQIRSADHHDVLVTTYDSVPDDQQDSLKTKGKDKFYNDWVDQIAAEHGVSGVAILLVRNPGHLQIAVGNKTRQRIFTVDDRDALREQMLATLHGKQYDQALLEGLRFIKTRMDQNEGGTSAAQNGSSPANPASPVPSYTPNGGRPGGGLPVMWIVIGVGILIIVFMIIKSASRNAMQGGGYNAGPGNYGGGGYNQGGYAGGGGYGGGGGGGGFGRGILGGLLGGALGAWGYDKFSRPNESNPGVGGGGGSSSDQSDTSYSSTGGDIGGSSSSSSGGDFGSSSGGGGGDFGGGDTSSGGDFGGGGGDSGGGGGDF